ncbi:hypothetical protein GCM10020331_074850 [Ectobacillus funiculus]
MFIIPSQKFFSVLCSIGDKKTIDFTLVKYLAIGSIPSAICAVGVLHLFDSFFHNQELIIRHALGYVLIIVALMTLVKNVP